MPRFTKAEMLNELRTIFLYEAEHIVLGRGHDVAEAFIGFPQGEDDYTRCEPDRVDLDKFNITRAFERCYDYAFSPSPLNASNGEETWETHAFMEGTPKIGSVWSAENHDFMTPEGLCRTTSDMAGARLELDKGPGHGATFSVRDLALLADMSEGAVRNAISLGEKGGLKAIKGSKPARVDYADAYPWLLSRRGFVDYPKSTATDPFLTDRIKNADDLRDLTRLMMEKVRIRYEGGLEEAHDLTGAGEESFFAKVGRVSWDEVADTLRRLDVAETRRIAEALEFDVPLFVGKATELCLRAELTGGRA